MLLQPTKPTCYSFVTRGCQAGLSIFSSLFPQNLGLTPFIPLPMKGAQFTEQLILSHWQARSFFGSSHARTVVRECCKGDDESQWERGKFDPPPPKNPWTDGHQKFVYLTMSGISTTTQNFIQIGLGVSVLRMRDFAPLGRKWLGYFLGVLEKGYSRDTRTDFDAKYVKRRGSAQGSAFWGSRNQNLRLWPPFPPKTAIFGPHFDGTEFFRPKTALTLDRSRVNDP